MNVSNSFSHGIIPFCSFSTEAAELDAVDDFVATIVHLSFLEDDEELTRADIGHSFKKRWEARVSFRTSRNSRGYEHRDPKYE